MQKVHLLLLFTLFVAGLSAQTQGENTIILPRPVGFIAEATLTTSPAFQLPHNAELRQVGSHLSTSGREHVKYHQYLEGLQVLGGTVTFHIDNGQLYATTGRLPEVGQTVKDFHLNAKQAEKLAVLRLGQDLRLAQGLQIAETTRAFANAAYPGVGGATVAVFVVRIKADGGPDNLPIDTEVIINASSGRVLANLSNIHTETINGHGDGFYHQDINFPVDSVEEGRYELYDRSRGRGVLARDVSNNVSTPWDEDNEWTPELEGHQAMIDGYYASVKFYDFLQDRFSRNSLNDEGFPLTARMNQHNFVNAYWNGSTTTYGNGNCDDYSPLTTFTIVGHEYAHGLTQFTSDLIYQGESGALNESISDIIGKAFQFYYDNDHFDWRIGSDIRRRSDVRYFRDMANPSQRNHPKFYKGENWRTGPSDRGGVHSNSGVFNFWFHVLVEGKKSTNEAGEFYDIEAIGMDSALQLVYLLETAYLTESSGYQDCHDFSLLAADELFGEESGVYASVVEAWRAVGLPAVQDTIDGVVELSVTSEVLSQQGFFDAPFCPAELENLLYNVALLPSIDEVPYGSLLDGIVVFSYFADGATVVDTNYFNNLLTTPSNYDEDGLLTLILSHQLIEGGNSIDLIGAFNITTPSDQEYSFTTTTSLSINEVTELELVSRLNRFGRACLEPSVFFDHYFIDLPRCPTLPGGVIRVVYTNGTDELIYEKEIPDDEGSSITISPEEDTDLSELGSYNGISYKIFHVEDGVETLLLHDNYSRHFANVIEEEVIYDFDDQVTSEIDLGIGFCSSCPQDFNSEKINIRDSSFIGAIQLCTPPSEFVSSQVQDIQSPPSSVLMCIDAANIDEPHLVFTLNQEDSAEFDAEENQFLHMVDVYFEDRSILDEPITSTNGNNLEVEIPLPLDFDGTLNIHVFSNGVTTTIDKLGVTAGAPSAVRRLGVGDFGFNYLNPITDRIQIQANKAVPAGTKATLLNTSGQIVGTALMQGLQFGMDTGHLPAGLYFLTISDGSTFRWTVKIVRHK
jgi:Zn-dependent metalloprotease